MTLDDVPADTLMALTDELDRLFKFAGCNPACHVCGRKISVKGRFRLVSYRGEDRMTCARSTCTRAGLERKHQAKIAPGGGYDWAETNKETGEGFYRIIQAKGYSRPTKGSGGGGW